MCVNKCGNHVREGLIEKERLCIYPPCTGSMESQSGASSKVIHFWIGVTSAISEMQVLKSERAHEARMAAIELPERIMHDIENMLVLVCPACSAPVILDQGCAALTCSRCQLDFCAACLQSVPAEALSEPGVTCNTCGI